jgi:hypothetical protein
MQQDYQQDKLLNHKWQEADHKTKNEPEENRLKTDLKMEVHDKKIRIEYLEKLA